MAAGHEGDCPEEAGSPGRLVLAEVPRPVRESNEVLVPIYATSVVRSDVVMRNVPRLAARLLGETPKLIPGHEFAGEIETTGENVTVFKIGDRVFGTTSGLTRGSFAEYLCVPADGMVAHMPQDVGYEEAAPIPVGAMTALHFLQAGNVGPGTRVLVNGASGSAGSYAVQIAKHMGAHVTGVAGASNAELVASLGADSVIDYSKEDFTEGAEKYDVIFYAVGKTTATRTEGVLAEHGRFVSTRKRRREKAEAPGRQGNGGQWGCHGPDRPVLHPRADIRGSPVRRRWPQTGQRCRGRGPRLRKVVRQGDMNTGRRDSIAVLRQDHWSLSSHTRLVARALSGLVGGGYEPTS